MAPQEAHDCGKKVGCDCSQPTSADSSADFRIEKLLKPRLHGWSLVEVLLLTLLILHVGAEAFAAKTVDYQTELAATVVTPELHTEYPFSQ